MSMDLTQFKGHTPGRWIAVGRWVEHMDDNTPDICNADPAAMGQEGRSDAECCANARLMAAAPALLAEVRRLTAEVRRLTAEMAARPAAKPTDIADAARLALYLRAWVQVKHDSVEANITYGGGCLYGSAHHDGTEADKERAYCIAVTMCAEAKGRRMQEDQR